MTEKLIRKGFIAAGLMNIVAVLTFSRFFTNEVIPETDPVVMSNFGLLMIVVWGFAYLGTAANYKNVKWVVGTFVIEKLIYVIAWGKWIGSNDISAVYDKDLFAGIFFSVYGINDFIFFVFFIMVFYKLLRNKN
ncbi:hypothetical protein BC962_1761 [Gillisia mitskevichiae]|uniref:Uncharacterized protein n=1 Tax=Gillisia mitskevichiae TaxID=270921 RepID=A0A495PXJ4_9FLAO|nr:hypothetical protein [Gillisia mitskevichiae]RKS53509.1 hypothetical protein BC962_1761 [Gillisia mitskevichiae]